MDYGNCACCDNKAIVYCHNKKHWVCADHYTPSGVKIDEMEHYKMVQEGVALLTRIVELEGVIKWIEDEGVTVQVMKNISEENARLREAVEYMADPDNWIEEDGWLKMKRPGGGKQDGIMLVSNDLSPWVFLLKFRRRAGREG
jgi:hypothetical protein